VTPSAFVFTTRTSARGSFGRHAFPSPPPHPYPILGWTGWLSVPCSHPRPDVRSDVSNDSGLRNRTRPAGGGRERRGTAPRKAAPLKEAAQVAVVVNDMSEINIDAVLIDRGEAALRSPGRRRWCGGCERGTLASRPVRPSIG
jgi:hypothetical protein